MFKKSLVIILLLFSGDNIVNAELGVEEAKVAFEEVANPGLARIGKGGETGMGTMNVLLKETGNESIIKTSESKGGFTVISSIAVWLKKILTSLVMLISIGAFLYVGIKLSLARGNPEEFKKALMHMIYVVVGIFVVAMSWATVTLVAGLNL